MAGIGECRVNHRGYMLCIRAPEPMVVVLALMVASIPHPSKRMVFIVKDDVPISVLLSDARILCLDLKTAVATTAILCRLWRRRLRRSVLRVLGQRRANHVGKLGRRVQIRLWNRERFCMARWGSPRCCSIRHARQVDTGLLASQGHLPLERRNYCFLADDCLPYCLYRPRVVDM